jgi:hypothetical protein
MKARKAADAVRPPAPRKRPSIAGQLGGATAPLSRAATVRSKPRHDLSVRARPAIEGLPGENPSPLAPYFAAARNAPIPGSLLKFLMIALAIAYPVTAHMAVSSRSVAVTAVSLAALASLFLLPRLVARSVVAWCALPVVAGALLLLAHSHVAWLPL